MNRDILPHDEADLIAWSEQFVAELPAVAGAIGLDPAQVAQLQASEADWAAQVEQDVQIKAAARASTQAKRAARTAYEQRLRGVVRQIQAAPATTDPMRRELGLKVPDRKLTRRGPEVAGEDRPLIRRVEAGALTHTLRWVNAPTPTSRARPAWALGTNVYLKIGGDPPIGTGGEQGAAMIAFVRSTPFKHQFKREHLGQQAWWILRWTDGETESHLSEVYGATVAG